MSRDRGIIQVYTGDGKGKTSAAWGQALRAVGRGWRIAVVRFLKPGTSGEVIAAERCVPAISVFGETSPHDPSVDQRHSPVLREECRRNFDDAARLIAADDYDMVVLDELCVVLFYGFVSKDEVLSVLMGRPACVDIVITGRYAPEWLVDAADLVTAMTDVKHPAAEGVSARTGIEF